jgi:ribonuclease-3
VECGFDAARGFVTLLLGDEIDAAVANPVAVGDYKSSLQEYLARGSLVPTYEMTWEGPDHARKFYAKVYADEDLLGVGSGVSKKQAQQEAAKDALIQLGIGA